MKLPAALRSLRNPDYRVWSVGALVSNVGTWMQRTAQDWLVLAELTHHNAIAVGVVTALQFAPQLLLLPLTGWAADHFDRRRLLVVTQSAMGILALVLGLLTLTGAVRLWHVNVLAFLLGCAAAFDSPVRNTFVGELVEEADLANAVGLNSASFNAARMLGPAVAGVLIGPLGSGWVFLSNAASYVAVLVSLAMLRPKGSLARQPPGKARGGLLEGFRYVWHHPELRIIILMLFLVGTFGLHFPIFISTMAVSVFHRGPGGYGAATSVLAVGSLTGAVLAAGRPKPRLSLLLLAAAGFGLGFALAASMPNYFLFAGALVLIGICAQTLTTSANATLQLLTEPRMRGRVLAIFLAVALGATPIGAPFVGWVADRFGPRWSLAVAATAGLLAAALGLFHLLRHREPSPSPQPTPNPGA